MVNMAVRHQIKQKHAGIASNHFSLEVEFLFHDTQTKDLNININGYIDGIKISISI